MTKRPVRIENVTSYVKSINNYPLLTRDREKELADLIHGADPQRASQALDELITSNLKLVVKIAHDFKMFDLGFDDLVSEGNMGLVTAAKRFTSDGGAKFSCYAAWWIKQAMRKALADKTRTIRLPVEQAKRQLALDRMIAEFAEDTGRPPTDEELAEACGLPVSRIRDSRQIARCDIFLDSPVEAGDNTTVADLIPDGRDVESKVDSERHEELQKLLKRLTDLDRCMLTWTYGLAGHTLSPDVIAQETGVIVPSITLRISDLLQDLRAGLTS